MNRPRPNKSHAGEHTTAGPPGGLAAVLRHDLPASLVVFLISVPLSLGVAAATGAPLMAGLISAVVGGILAGALSGTPVLVSGPATGSVVIIAGVIAEYGWAATAAITLAAGAVQIAFGLGRLGRVALSLSPAVVHGMLAGIGLSIAVGQLSVVVGGSAATSVLDNLANVLTADVGWSALLVGALAVLALLLWPHVPRAGFVPAPLVAVLAATLATVGLDVARVDLPADLLGQVVLPRVPSGSFGAVTFAVLTVAVVTSVESLLSAVAVDKLHDGPRADLDRELIAQGAANVVTGALGGLPIAGAIARSSTNVAAGARTRASTVLHGLWVAVFVLALGWVLELIPLAALAGVLLVVGVRLVSVRRMRALWRHGEFSAYAVTVVGVLVLGLVEGVLLGVAAAVLRSLYRLTRSSVRIEEEPDSWRVTIRGSLVFLGAGRLVRGLRAIPLGQRVVLELHIDFLDHGAYEAIDDWRVGYERLGGHVEVDEVHDTWFSKATRGIPALRKTPLSPLPRWFAPWSHWQRGRHVTLPRQRADADPMIRGMREFERTTAPLVRPFLAELAARGQRPRQLFITCADSRVVPNLITTSGPGDLFCVRNIGNLVPLDGDDSVGAAIEYAVEVLAVETIAVCGHSDCGAMKAVVHGSTRPGTQLHTWLKAVEPSLIRFHAGESDLPVVERLSVANVAQQLDNLMAYPSVREAVAARSLRLVGMYFDISAARVYLVDPERDGLEPVCV
ncbi:bifunctional SulP family inorganic anion transporter/carbonic anhydrase [Saccharothrix sp. 6-C]|uniref:carbonic anhydrase n=1 Tax=Saccharothrix texasensis TaxID=103734 RepID=A0A3N1HEP6_9PSEU|nr:MULTISPECIES: SulP family inorganic anion transporter [Saccharothrix]QQQ74956.1 bifunctional SulP family inorganic anion transporter/carbonic anhydrase [Saccharothrix sp. 6-C]ROP40981.1 carbonic anhydrase [Saccharothrix texasensis]